MNYKRKTTRFAIYKTNQAIEIYANDRFSLTSNLICTCDQYQSAVRIAKSAAKIMDLPWKQP